MNPTLSSLTQKAAASLVLLSLATNSFGRDRIRFSSSSAKNPKMELVSYERNRDLISYPCETPGGVTFGGRFGDGTTEGQVDMLAPLNDPYNSGIATFLMLNYLHSDYGQESFGVGLGTRWMMDSINSVAGFRIHGDFSDTQLNNSISQLNFGFDLFHAKGFDLHANYYLPTSRSQRQTYRMDESSTSSEYFTNEYCEDPYAAENQIRQNYTYEEVERTTTTDISRLLQQFERGREGGDIRLVFDLLGNECGPKVRGMIGGYAYDGLYSDSLFGAMAGVYALPLPGLQFGVEYYGDDDLYGSNWVATVGATIKTDFQNMFRPAQWGKGGSNPYAPDCKNSGKYSIPAPQSDYLASRMYATAPRMNRPVLERSDVTEVSRVVNREVSETVVGTESGTNVLLDNVIFVNNGGAVGNGIQAGAGGGNGTAEAPVDTIQGGTSALIANFGGVGNVYVQGGGAAYNEVVEAGFGAGAGVTSVSYYSSFKPIEGGKGMNFGGDTARAQVVGGFELSNLSYGQVSGFDITGGNSNDHGITATNNDIIDINCNIITGVTDSGILVFNDSGVRSASVTENTVNNAGNIGIAFATENDAQLTITNLDDNTVVAPQTAGIVMEAYDTSNIQVDSMRRNSVDGVAATVAPNDLASSGGAAYGFYAADTASIVAENVSENRAGDTTPLARGTGAGNFDANHGFRIYEDGAGASIVISGEDNVITWDGAAGAPGTRGNSVFATGDTIAAGAGGFEVNNASAIFNTDPYRLD
ncbi:inverse autotransporter beta domain-containing protein [Verrucomicrobiales bacterium BCK34]|nr:inverse autotransporter beta domain-containing protein [Verrucomicrobiales bacterium BCK34]